MPYKDLAKRKDYHRSYLQKWFPAHPGHRRKHNWKRRGLDSDEAERKCNLSTNCDICGKLLHGYLKHIDRDHKTMKIRVVLCKNCNQAIGLFREDKETIERAIEYLRLGT
ncbi:MAG: hypothetical protein KGI38_04445 [Thaumarchaeota archaeon]|nr:hypothetical protein [Nitrososphaerota archaeon]